MRRILNGKVGIALSVVYDIKTVTILTPPRGKEPEKERVCVEFAYKSIKIKSMKLKKNLKETKNMWISDNLIPSQMKLIYDARMSVKHGRHSKLGHMIAKSL